VHIIGKYTHYSYYAYEDEDINFELLVKGRGYRSQWVRNTTTMTPFWLLLALVTVAGVGGYIGRCELTRRRGTTAGGGTGGGEQLQPLWRCHN
jgi:hypothetical protein